jgi:hypothetical protein
LVEGSNTKTLTDVIGVIAGALDPLEPADRTRVLRAVGALLNEGDGGVGDEFGGGVGAGAGVGTSGAAAAAATPGQSLGTIRQFLAVKRPESAIEQLACLGYFKEKAGGVAQYKTKDLTALNHDAGGGRIGNPAQAMDNAKKAGILVAVPGGNAKLSILGEQLVEALPDRDAVKAVRSNVRAPRRGRKRTAGAKKAAAKKAPARKAVPRSR